MARSGRIVAFIAIALIGLGGLALLLVARRMVPPPKKVRAPASVVHEPVAAAEWYARGNELLNGAKNLRGAAEAYRRAAELAPGMGEAHYGRGYALLQLGDLDGAIPELESALSLAPEGAPWRKDAENALVRAHLLKGQPEKR